MSATFELGDRVRAAPAALATRVGDEVAILHLDRASYFGLNATGAWIWERLQQPATLAELRDGLTAAFDTTPEQAAADVLAFVGALEGAGLVERVTG
jgi:hypothetical protein